MDQTLEFEDVNAYGYSSYYDADSEYDYVDETEDRLTSKQILKINAHRQTPPPAKVLRAHKLSYKYGK